MNAALNGVLADPAIRAALEKQGMAAAGGEPQRLGDLLEARARALGARGGRRRNKGRLSGRTLEDLVAAYRILAAHGVIDAYGHVSLRSPRDPERYLPRALRRPRSACSARRPDRVRPRQQPARRARPRVGARALHPRRDLQGAARGHGGGAQPLALGGAVQRHRRADAAGVPHGRVHRRRAAELRDPRRAEGHGPAGEDAPPRRSARADALDASPRP